MTYLKYYLDVVILTSQIRATINFTNIQVKHTVYCQFKGKGLTDCRFNQDFKKSSYPKMSSGHAICTTDLGQIIIYEHKECSNPLISPFSGCVYYKPFDKEEY